MKPDWVNDELYPFESNFMQQEAGKIHYLDEGSGHPVVMLHGNPTWSFLYRKVISGLLPQYRCIAPDHLGFGLSDKPPDWSYTPEAHAQNFEEFIKRLDLEKFTLVCQDWGGPIGLSYALKNPDHVHSVVVMNTWMWPMDSSWRAWFFSNFIGGPIGRFSIEYLNLFLEWGIPIATSSPLSTEIMEHYRRPFVNTNHRKPIWIFPGAILSSTPFLRRIWNNRRNLSQMKVMIAWGMKDFAFGQRELNRWRSLLPDACFHPLDEASHFLQEDSGSEIAQKMKEFLR